MRTLCKAQADRLRASAGRPRDPTASAADYNHRSRGCQGSRVPGRAKVMDLPRAVSTYARSGVTVSVDGCCHRVPFADAYEVIRPGRRDLTLCRMTPDLMADQLLPAGGMIASAVAAALPTKHGSTRSYARSGRAAASPRRGDAVACPTEDAVHTSALRAHGTVLNSSHAALRARWAGRGDRLLRLGGQSRRHRGGRDGDAPCPRRVRHRRSRGDGGAPLDEFPAATSAQDIP